MVYHHGTPECGYTININLHSKKRGARAAEHSEFVPSTCHRFCGAGTSLGIKALGRPCVLSCVGIRQVAKNPTWCTMLQHVATCRSNIPMCEYSWSSFFWHHSKHWLYRSGRFCMVLPTLGKDAGSWLHAICGTNALLIAGRTSLSTVYLWICWPPCQPPLLMISHDVWKEFAATMSSSQLIICFYNYKLAGRKHLRVKHLWVSIFKQTSSPCHPILEKPCANQTSAWWPRWSSGELHRFVPPWGFPPWEPWICATGLQNIDIPSRFTMIHRYFCWAQGKLPKITQSAKPGNLNDSTKGHGHIHPAWDWKAEAAPEEEERGLFWSTQTTPQNGCGDTRAIWLLHWGKSVYQWFCIYTRRFVRTSFLVSIMKTLHTCTHWEAIQYRHHQLSILCYLICKVFSRPCLRLSGNRLQDSKGIIPAGKNLGSKKWDRCKDGGSSDSCRPLWSGIYIYI